MEKSVPFESCSVKAMEEGMKHPPAGTASDAAGKNDSNPPSKQVGVPLSPFAAVGAKRKLEETTQSGESSAVDCFYAKLRKLCESSGVPIIEETKMDLYKLYKEVVERGGFEKVLKCEKWEEVASSFNSGSTTESMEASQLQKIYSNILYNYEQIYHYRSAKKDSTNYYSTGEKRKHPEFPCSPPTDEDDNETIVVKKKNSPKTTVEKLQRDKNAPMSPRTAYQMFLKIECIRLKKIHNDGEDKTSGNQNFRDIAIDAWRHLSKADRQPYVEESKKDKERFNEEMAVYMASEKKKTENMTSEIKFSSSLKKNEKDYNVKVVSVPTESVAATTVDDKSFKIPATVDDKSFKIPATVDDKSIKFPATVGDKSIKFPATTLDDKSFTFPSTTLDDKSFTFPSTTLDDKSFTFPATTVDDKSFTFPATTVDDKSFTFPSTTMDDKSFKFPAITVDDKFFKFPAITVDDKFCKIPATTVKDKSFKFPATTVDDKSFTFPTTTVDDKSFTFPTTTVDDKSFKFPAITVDDKFFKFPSTTVGDKSFKFPATTVEDESFTFPATAVHDKSIKVAATTVDDESIKVAETSSSLFHVNWNDGRGSLDLT